MSKKCSEVDKAEGRATVRSTLCTSSTSDDDPVERLLSDAAFCRRNSATKIEKLREASTLLSRRGDAVQWARHLDQILTFLEDPSANVRLFALAFAETASTKNPQLIDTVVTKVRELTLKEEKEDVKEKAMLTYERVFTRKVLSRRQVGSAALEVANNDRGQQPSTWGNVLVQKLKSLIFAEGTTAVCILFLLALSLGLLGLVKGFKRWLIAALAVVGVILFKKAIISLSRLYNNWSSVISV